MKPAILVAVAAMAFAIVSIPDVEAKAWWGRHGLELKLTGSNFITSSEGGRPTPNNEVNTSLQSGIIRGGGSGLFSAQTTIEQAGMDSRCEATLPFGADLFTTIVLTYHDGSQLTLQATGPESFYCTNGETFVVDLGGTVLGGEGRYEDATGTWEGTAEAFQSRVTANIELDLD